MHGTLANLVQRSDAWFTDIRALWCTLPSDSDRETLIHVIYRLQDKVTECYSILNKERNAQRNA